MAKTLSTGLPTIAAKAHSYGWLVPLVRGSFLYGGFLLFLVGEIAVFGDIPRQLIYAAENDLGARHTWRFRIYAIPPVILLGLFVYFRAPFFCVAFSWISWCSVALFLIARCLDRITLGPSK